MQRELKQTATIPFWRDERVLKILGQIIFALLVLFVGALIYQNMRTGLAKQGISLSYSFLGNISGFDLLPFLDCHI